MTRQSRDYEKVGTKANANGWAAIRKYGTNLREAHERNPLLAQQYNDLNCDIIHHRQIAADAWGYHYSEDNWPEAMREYYQQYLDPLEAEQAIVREMLYCKHTKIDMGEDCETCRKCGAANYGKGFVFHKPIVADIDVPVTL